MRINKFVAQATGMSRREADTAITRGLLKVNGAPAQTGQEVGMTDKVELDGRILNLKDFITVLLNKPVGYVCSRDGQGSKTIYDLLPAELHNLKPVGRLDKDSSGLLLLTNDGELAHKLTHPSYQKEKIYELEIDKPLQQKDFEEITKQGVDIGNTRSSQFQLQAIGKMQDAKGILTPNYFLPFTFYWRATLAEGRNRQIRRTFAHLGYEVKKLHRTQFGEYRLQLKSGNWRKI